MKNNREHRMLLEFAWFVEETMPIYINNALILEKNTFGKTDNRVFSFIVEHAILNIIETLVFNVWEMSGILDTMLKKFGKEPLGYDDDHKDLDRMRDKLLGHRVVNAMRSPNHINWVKKEYETASNVFSLVRRVAGNIKNCIDELEEDEKISSEQLSIKEPVEITQEDMDKLLSAIK